MALTLQKQARGPQPAPPSGADVRLPTARGVLTAAEIEMLLRPDLPEPVEPEPEQVVDHGVFDFARQDNANLAGEGAELAARLTLSARKSCRLDAVFSARSARRSDLSEISDLLDGPSVLIAFEDETRSIQAALILSPALATELINIACGGVPARDMSAPNRPFTALDRLIIENALQPLAGTLDPAFSIGCVETDPGAIAALLASGPAMLAELDCRMGHVEDGVWFARRSETTERDRPAIEPGAGSGLEATLTARIASLQVPVSHLADLKAGSMLLLGLPTDQPVELLSGGPSGQLAAEGEIGRKGNKMAVRITRRGPALRR